MRRWPLHSCDKQAIVPEGVLLRARLSLHQCEPPRLSVTQGVFLGGVGFRLSELGLAPPWGLRLSPPGYGPTGLGSSRTGMGSYPCWTSAPFFASLSRHASSSIHEWIIVSNSSFVCTTGEIPPPPHPPSVHGRKQLLHIQGHLWPYRL